MKAPKLIDYRYRTLGWVIFIPCFLLGILIMFSGLEFDMFETKTFAFFNHELLGKQQWFTIIDNNILDELLTLGMVISSIILMFSKEKIEDEYTRSLRLNALAWAIVANYLILAIFTILFYGAVYYSFLIINLFTIPIIFLMRFNYLKHKQDNNEE